MIEIENVDFNGISGTFDAIIDGQRIVGCRAVIGRRSGQIDAIPPQSASAIDWGDHSLADLSKAFSDITINTGNIAV